MPGNRWDLLEPTPVDPQQAPHVSICIPTRNGGETLRRTLTMLALQTYPAERLQVVVADDGSEPPLDLSALGTPYELVVVRQEPDGFGAGRARNLAASRADGQMLVFLDADVIPEPTVIDQYVRWMSASNLAVPFGFSRFVDWPDVSDDVMAERLVGDTMDDVFPSDDVDSQEYREPYLAATHDLLDERLVRAAQVSDRKERARAWGIDAPVAAGPCQRDGVVGAGAVGLLHRQVRRHRTGSGVPVETPAQQCAGCAVCGA